MSSFVVILPVCACAVVTFIDSEVVRRRMVRRALRSNALFGFHSVSALAYEEEKHPDVREGQQRLVIRKIFYFVIFFAVFVTSMVFG